MWRKSNDAKPSAEPASKPLAQPVPPAPAKSQATEITPAPIAAPAAAMPPTAAAAPVFSAPAGKNVIAHDTTAASSLGSGLKVRGELSGSSDLYIDGEAQGKITLPESRVTIGPNGRVRADIDAREIIIGGVAQGNFKAKESVRLISSSTFEGSIVTPRIRIDEGAKLRGGIEMTRAGESKGKSAGETPAVVAEAYQAAVASSESESSKQ